MCWENTFFDKKEYSWGPSLAWWTLLQLRSIVLNHQISSWWNEHWRCWIKKGPSEGSGDKWKYRKSPPCNFKWPQSEVERHSRHCKDNIWACTSYHLRTSGHEKLRTGDEVIFESDAYFTANNVCYKNAKMVKKRWNECSTLDGNYSLIRRSTNRLYTIWCFLISYLHLN